MIYPRLSHRDVESRLVLFKRPRRYVVSALNHPFGYGISIYLFNKDSSLQSYMIKSNL